MTVRYKEACKFEQAEGKEDREIEEFGGENSEGPDRAKSHFVFSVLTIYV